MNINTKRISVVFAPLVLIMFCSILTFRRSEIVTVKELLDAHGTPDLIASNVEFLTRSKVPILRVHANGIDPTSIQSPESLGNVILVWATTDVCRRNIRYFYEEIKTDAEFTGSTWYSSRSVFGENVHFARLLNEGGGKLETAKIGAISIKLEGFVRGKREQGNRSEGSNEAANGSR